MPAKTVAQFERAPVDSSHWSRLVSEAFARALPLGTVPQDRDDQLRQVDAIEAVRFLVEQYGAARVARWVRHVAVQRGEAL